MNALSVRRDLRALGPAVFRRAAQSAHGRRTTADAGPVAAGRGVARARSCVRLRPLRAARRALAAPHRSWRSTSPPPCSVAFPRAQRVCGELTSLPLRDGVFDLVLSGLALGHAADLGGVLRRDRACSRARRQAAVFGFSSGRVAARIDAGRSPTPTAGSFRCPRPRTIAPLIWTACVARVSFSTRCHEPRVGIEFTEPFAGSERFYREWHGAPILLLVRARKA